MFLMLSVLCHAVRMLGSGLCSTLLQRTVLCCAIPVVAAPAARDSTASHSIAQHSTATAVSMPPRQRRMLPLNL